MIVSIICNLNGTEVETPRLYSMESGNSEEQEARRVVTSAEGMGSGAAADRLAAVRRRIGRLQGLSSLDELRRDRARD